MLGVPGVKVANAGSAGSEMGQCLVQNSEMGHIFECLDVGNARTKVGQ
jgi:hypothetical protein